MDCEGCEYARPPVLMGNLSVKWVFDRLAPALTDGLGGISVGNIIAGLQGLGIPRQAWPHLLNRLLLLARQVLVNSEIVK